MQPLFGKISTLLLLRMNQLSTQEVMKA